MTRSQPWALPYSRVLRRGKWGDWAIWVVANVASWYVYYYLALLTVAEAELPATSVAKPVNDWPEPSLVNV